MASPRQVSPPKYMPMKKKTANVKQPSKTKTSLSC